MANKKNDPNHLGFGRLMAWKSSDIAMAGLNVIVLGYLSIYCSDTLGIAPAVVGTVLMVSKIIDAFTDIFAGWLVDNTHTKLGKGRPYELAIVGVMLCSLGLFSGSPAWSNTLKVVWIFCMYTLVFSIFTTLRGAANTPYTIRHFSNNPILIRKVASYGGIITMAGSMIVSILFPIVMSKLATSAGGWRTTVAIFVLPLLLISLLRFFFCKEDSSVDGGDEQFQPVRLNEIFSMFRRNKYVWLYAIIMLCYNISTSLAVTTLLLQVHHRQHRYDERYLHFQHCAAAADAGIPVDYEENRRYEQDGRCFCLHRYRWLHHCFRLRRKPDRRPARRCAGRPGRSAFGILRRSVHYELLHL